MSVTTKKVLVPFVDGEMANCYDTSCLNCNGPDCFLNEGLLIDDHDVTRKDATFWYSGGSIDFALLTKS